MDGQTLAYGKHKNCRLSRPKETQRPTDGQTLANGKKDYGVSKRGKDQWMDKLLLTANTKMSPCKTKRDAKTNGWTNSC